MTDKFPYKKARLIVGKRWYVAFSAWDVSKGELVYKRLFDPLNRIKDKTERRWQGLAMVRQINRELSEGKTFGKDQPVINNVRKNVLKLSLLDAIQYVIDQKKLTNHRENYLHDFRRLKKTVSDWLAFSSREDFPVRNFTDNDTLNLFEWVSRKQLANKTVNNYRNDLATAFNFLQKKSPGLFEVNPAFALDKLPVTNKKHAALTDTQMISIKDKCNELGFDQLLWFIRFVYYTFARPKEIISIKIEHIDLVAKVLFIPGEVSKSDRDDFIGIPPQFADMLTSLHLYKYPRHYYFFGKGNQPAEKRIGYLQLYNRNRKVFEALGLDKSDRQYSVYSYKHSGVIALYQATRDIKLVQSQCRHTSLDQTNDYLRDLNLLANYDGLKDWTIAI